MNLATKQLVIGTLGFLFLGSLVFVQYQEVTRRRAEAGEGATEIVVPKASETCVNCHSLSTPAMVEQWKSSKHAQRGVGCVECHRAQDGEADAFVHYGATIATVVTPLDCGRCHPQVFGEFEHSHHAAAGNILASLDNTLAETVEGAREPFDPHSPTPGRPDRAELQVNGMASAFVGCQQCHGSKVALRTLDGGRITVDDLRPDAEGRPGVPELLGTIARVEGRPVYDSATWPNTGIGRINLDGSRGSCSACHSRHDFSPRRARQPENCGKCHLGPDHPQKEIYEESKHGVAYRDLREHMNLDAESWVLGKDYSQAPTCATCHMSANTRNGEKVTHDPGERISWTNRPPISLAMDTDADHEVIKSSDPAERARLVADSWQQKRERMKEVCSHCHTPAYVEGFYRQYDDFVVLYNEKFAKPGKAIMDALLAQKLRTPADFDEEIEWTWFYLWHHEGRRARHGAAMMAPDYAHWHGMYEVAERFYQGLIPQARELCARAAADGRVEAAAAVEAVIDGILARPEHGWLARAQDAR